MRSSTSEGKVWRSSCGVVMALAMLVSVFGTLPFLRRYEAAGPGASLGDGLLLLIWGFGLLGVFFAYLADAMLKRLLAAIAFGWSIAALAWDAAINACPQNMACARDTSDHAALFGACLVAVVLLVLYDKYQDRLPAAGRTLTRGLASVLITVWSISLLLAVLFVSKPISAARVQAVSLALPGPRLV